MIGQHLALNEQLEHPHANLAGLLCKNTNPAHIAEMAASEASELCTRYYGSSPEIEILGEKQVTFPYLSNHLYFQLFDILKNSLRAVVENHPKNNLPPVRVFITERGNDVTIRVSDEGKGIPRKDMVSH